MDDIEKIEQQVDNEISELVRLKKEVEEAEASAADRVESLITRLEKAVSILEGRTGGKTQSSLPEIQRAS